MLTPDSVTRYRHMVAWLEENAGEDDIIPGATYVGNGRGSLNSDWDVYDEAALEAEMKGMIV